MHVQDKKEDCCGCTACMTICPVKAITMVPDEEGFSYPVINEEKCIHCDLCRKTCDFVKKHDWPPMKQPKAYAAKMKSGKERAASQSGGMFAALSEAVLDMGGAVYGACFDSNWNIVHKRATTKKERDAMRGSKYVQSSMGDNFEKVITDLQAGKYVLFSGTHCQCAGLKSLLEMKKINTEKLFLVDLICHGVPSPKVYQAFRNFMIEKHKGKLEGFKFRNKAFGWRRTVESTYINGQEYNTTLYSTLFSRDNALREACYQCPYKNINQFSDITIGDFWGIEKWAADFDDGQGISLALLHTEKGEKLFNLIQDAILIRESRLQDCIQPCLERPMSRPASREQFWYDFQQKPFTYILAHYTTDYGWKNQTKKGFKKVIRSVLPKSAIAVLKKLRG
ncbi:Coenzyme F420 hydrogenase/dehydrogenase, beta subunit C-terminal domain [Acidaminococcus sp.]|uniref:Coenzyme F420 hydrogenase/dehydrogenase, beta subunit C-terminal domain n=1 Tax=Acidaminococcus sp. TaxID=1872103 RepID=UPI0035224E8E